MAAESIQHTLVLSTARLQSHGKSSTTVRAEEADTDERKMMGSRRSFSSGPRVTLSDSQQIP